MKVRSAIKALCKDCYIVRRGKTRFVYCKTTPKHKQRQGYHSFARDSESTMMSRGHFCVACSAPVREFNTLPMSVKVDSGSRVGAVFTNTVLPLASLAPTASAPTTKALSLISAYQASGIWGLWGGGGARGIN